MRLTSLVSAFFAILVLLASIGCDGDSEQSGSASSAGAGGPSSPQRSAAVAGTRPALPVAVRKVLESATGTVRPAGGRIALVGGIELLFPADAVDAEIPVTLRLLDGAALYPGPGDDRLVIECDAPIKQFRKQVEIRIPLIADVKPEQAQDLIVGRIDETTGSAMVYPARVEVADGRTHLVVSTDRFSGWILFGGKLYLGYKAIGAVGNVLDLAKYHLWDSIPASRDPIRIPIYSQGLSPECLAGSIQMATKAVDPHCGETWKILEAGRIKGGCPNLSAAWNSGLAQIAQERSGAAPTICWWDAVFDMRGTPLLGALNRYLRRAIGVRGHPIVFGSTALRDKDRPTFHAVVLVGYDANGNWWVVDPQVKNKDDMKPVKKTADELGLSGGIKNNFLTMELNAELKYHREIPFVTVNVPPRGVWFEGPAGIDKTVYVFDWDGRQPGGQAWIRKNSLDESDNPPPPVAGVIAGDMTRLSMMASSPGVGLEVINADPDAPRRAEVSMQIVNLETNKVVAPTGDTGPLQQSLTIPPHSRAYVKFSVDLKHLRGESRSDQRFRATVTALSDAVPGNASEGMLIDRASFEFVLAPEVLPVGYWVLKERRAADSKLYKDDDSDPQGKIVTTHKKVAEGKFEGTHTINGQIRLKGTRLMTQDGDFSNIEMDYMCTASGDLTWDALPDIIPTGATWSIGVTGSVTETCKPDHPAARYFVKSARRRAAVPTLFDPSGDGLGCWFDHAEYPVFAHTFAKEGFHAGTVMMLGHNKSVLRIGVNDNVSEDVKIAFKNVPDGTTQTSELFIVLLKGRTPAASVGEACIYEFKKTPPRELEAKLKAVLADPGYTAPPLPDFTRGATAAPSASPSSPQPSPGAGATRMLGLKHLPPALAAREEAVFEINVEKPPVSASYAWDFGEPSFKGKPCAWTDTNRCKYSYGKPGKYTITVTVRDKAKYAVVLDKKSWTVEVGPEK